MTIRAATLAAISAAAIAFTGCGDSRPPQPAAQQTPSPAVEPAGKPKHTQKQLDNAIAAVKKERRVKDTAWQNESIPSLMAGVIPDGTPQHGYAQYLCHVLTDHGIAGGIVRVMDVGAATRGEWVELGKADCPTDLTVEYRDFTKPQK